jgi:hypothetical protein
VTMGTRTTTGIPTTMRMVIMGTSIASADSDPTSRQRRGSPAALSSSTAFAVTIVGPMEGQDGDPE